MSLTPLPGMHTFVKNLFADVLNTLWPASQGPDVCDTSWCTSPDGVGGYNCWANWQQHGEACSCSQGTARLTGDIYNPGGWKQYACCKSGNNGGSQCAATSQVTRGRLLRKVVLSACSVPGSSPSALANVPSVYLAGGDSGRHELPDYPEHHVDGYTRHARHGR